MGKNGLNIIDTKYCCACINHMQNFYQNKWIIEVGMYIMCFLSRICEILYLFD